MVAPILATKLYIPPPRPKMVSRPRLIDQLNEGLHRKLTLISAPAGFGKTTLVSDWLNHKDEASPVYPFKVAWLSLDEGDSEPTRFLAYLVAALQTVDKQFGADVLGMLQLPIETVLTTLLNGLTAVSHHIILVLDDYHLIDSQHY